MIKVGSDFSGVGAFNQALIRLGIDYEEVFACDMDKYARQTFCLNFGEPKYYPQNVYDREIPVESLDIFMSSPPCQSFSLAGKRKGEDDKRGILFYNTHEFIFKNNPRYFIIENVKGLLSDDGGKTFQRWIDYLGGKSVNGNPVIFPHEESTPYHVYYQVLNAKNYGIPQNRERVFIIGIRDDADNNFQFPKPFPLEKRLKDVLESEVDEKYFLSDKMINVLTHHQNKITTENENPEQSATIHAGYFKMGGRDQQYVKETKIGAIRGRNPENPKSRESGLPTEQMLEINENGTSNELTTVQKDNVVVYTGIAVHPFSKKLEFNGFKDGECPTLLATDYKAPKCIEFNNQRIRRLTPLECFRLMDFNKNFKWNVSDSQAYKQAGNSICVGVLASIIEKLKLTK